MELKQNHAFFHGTYSNLKSFFKQKILNYFNAFQNHNLSVSMIELNPNNGNETKSNMFSWDIMKSDIIFHWS